MPMLSRPRKPPWNRLRPSGSLRLTHHVKLVSSRWKTRARNARSPLPRSLGLALVDPQRRPRGHRRVDVAEVPLVGRDLPARVQIARVQQQLDLLLGEVDVDQRQRRAVEGQVPGREPGVLPLVRHRDDVAGDHVEPADVADVGRVRVPGVDAVLAQPAVHVVGVVLLAPQQARERLAHDQRAVGAERRRDDRGVERVGLLDPRGEDRVEVERLVGGRQPHADLGRLAGADLQHVVGGALGARASGERRTVDHVLVERRLRSGLVVAEQERCGGLEAPLAQRLVAREHRVAGGRERRRRPAVVPGVAEPQRRQQVQRRRLRAAVVRGDPHQDVVVRRLGVLDHDVEVAVVVEDAGVEQLVLEVLLAAAAVRGHQVLVGERPLRILVEALQVGVRRRRVEVEPVLLGVLAVVALAVGEPEHPLLEDRVGAVPERQRQAQSLLRVADPGDAVLAPAVRARARLVVVQEVPGVATGAVVLADGAPLALGQVRAPRLPWHRAGPGLLEPDVFRGLHAGRPYAVRLRC